MLLRIPWTRSHQTSMIRSSVADESISNSDVRRLTILSCVPVAQIVVLAILMRANRNHPPSEQAIAECP